MAAAAGLEAPAVRAKSQQASAMKRALWLAMKMFAMLLVVWVWYEIDDIEAGVKHGGHAKLAVMAIAVIGVIFLSPVEPMAEWFWFKDDDD